MPVTLVELFVLPVTNQEKARQFYVEQLGFEVVSDEPLATDRRWLQVRPLGAATSIALVTWFPTMLPGSVKGVVLQTSTLDQDIDEFVGRGVNIISEIVTAPWGRYVTFNDPDGNGLVLQSLDPSRRPSSI